ncbi:hypothetical protein SAY87_016548 [Trapa incisa]|uniref:AP2/ERF domain-containing protein n=1 Tax=Trapa incisa TaxID=236973 RepID=A0AAN7LHM8_9MYRT|nr:hypothetical protein SAY87_016548 [Trapa incisa]
MGETSQQNHRHEKINPSPPSAADHGGTGEGSEVVPSSSAAVAKVKRTRKSVPRESPLKRSSIYRGVTRHRWTGRFEAHLWDKNCWNESQTKKGRQGAYGDEEAAAHTYDLAALKYWGHETILNFPLSTYKAEVKEMEGQSREEYIGSLRRKSSGFSRGVSKYRGVARHHHNGRWEARIGRVFGNKYLYLGTYATQEEAAVAYDMAAIEHRGLNAVTNFDLSRYMKWIRPNGQTTVSDPDQTSPDGGSGELPNRPPELGFSLLTVAHQPSGETAVSVPQPGVSGGSMSSALGFLLQSSQFNEMFERTSPEEFPSTPSVSDMPLQSFPDDIQMYLDCIETNEFGEWDDGIFSDLSSLTSPLFHCELES